MERSKICRNQLLPYEDAVSIFDSIKAPRVTLNHNGEPFLNPDIFRIINYIHNRGSWTSITTNLNVLPGKPADVVKSGLDVLKISIDAATFETYNKIRKGGDLNFVLRTIQAILHEKRKLSKKKPLLRVGFVIQEQNYHEIDLFTQMAKDIGVNIVRFYNLRPMSKFQIPISFDLSLLSRKLHNAKKVALQNGINTNLNSISIKSFEIYSIVTKYNWRSFALLYKKLMNQQQLERKCLRPWLASNVLIDGTISPCCQLAPPDKTRIELGNVLHRSWENIWNGETYRTFRNSVKSGQSLPCINQCREVITLSNLFVFLKKLLPSIW